MIRCIFIFLSVNLGVLVPRRLFVSLSETSHPVSQLPRVGLGLVGGGLGALLHKLGPVQVDLAYGVGLLSGGLEGSGY
jgi:hypothetical protein